MDNVLKKIIGVPVNATLKGGIKVKFYFTCTLFFYTRDSRKIQANYEIIEKLSANNSRYRPFDNFILYLRARNNTEGRFIQ